MKPRMGLLFALIGILSVVGLIFHVASALPPPHAAPVALTSLTRVEQCIGLQFPVDSTLAYGTYNPQWHGWLFCKVLLSPVGQHRLTSQLSKQPVVLSRSREDFTSGIPRILLTDPEVHSSRQVLTASGMTEGGSFSIMIVSDDKSAPVAFVYWIS